MLGQQTLAKSTLPKKPPSAKPHALGQPIRTQDPRNKPGPFRTKDGAPAKRRCLNDVLGKIKPSRKTTEETMSTAPPVEDPTPSASSEMLLSVLLIVSCYATHPFNACTSPPLTACGVFGHFAPRVWLSVSVNAKETAPQGPTFHEKVPCTKTATTTINQ